MQRTFSFYKDNNGEWYVDLPEWKGDKADLQMVEGADTLLDLISRNREKCSLYMSDEIFDKAEFLTLIHIREKNLGGGGDYFLESYNGNSVQLKLWLCAVTEFVFQGLPQKIWFSVA